MLIFITFFFLGDGGVLGFEVRLVVKVVLERFENEELPES